MRRTGITAYRTRESRPAELPDPFHSPAARCVQRLVSSQRSRSVARSDPRCTGGREQSQVLAQLAVACGTCMASHRGLRLSSLLHVARQPVSASRRTRPSAPHSVFRRPVASWLRHIRTREALCAASDEVVGDGHNASQCARSIVVAGQARRERGQFLRALRVRTLTAGRQVPAAYAAPPRLTALPAARVRLTGSRRAERLFRGTPLRCRRRCPPRRWKSRLSTMASRPNPYRNGRSPLRAEDSVSTKRASPPAYHRSAAP